MPRPDMREIAKRIADNKIVPGYLNDTLRTIAWWKERRQSYIDYEQDWPENPNEEVEEYRQSKIKAMTEIIELLEKDAAQMNRRIS